MKVLGLVSAVTLGFTAQTSFGATLAIQGSDTLAGVMNDAVIASGLDVDLSYVGGGSGKGEKALLAGSQGLAPMSRAFKAKARAQAQAQGINLVEHVIGKDGVGVWVNQGAKVSELTLEQVKDIFTCKVTTWSQLGASSSATIKVYRRDDASGTTDTFKKLVGIKEFGACVTMISETSDIAQFTAKDVNALGFSGMSAKRATNQALAIAKDAGSQAYKPNAASVSSGNYPLSRDLYVYEAKGALTDVELELIELLLDPSFINPILQDNDFFLNN